MKEHRLYTYVPKDKTVDKDGLLSTALASRGWEKYQERTGANSRQEVLDALDAWNPDFRRSYAISALREPIGGNAHPDMKAFVRAKHLYSFDPAELLAAGILVQMHAINPGRRGTHQVSRVSYQNIDWAKKRPGRFLFSTVPHYIVETRDGRIPPEYVRDEEAQNA